LDLSIQEFLNLIHPNTCRSYQIKAAHLDEGNDLALEVSTTRAKVKD
jgi:hypothetical protein